MFIFSFESTFSQDIPQYDLSDVIITAGRTPISFSDLARNVTVIYSKDIQLLPVSSVTELLQYVAGVDLQQRGVNGTQADVTIRGGSFEQTLIMIDGIKISDPQTAHHNLNIPLSLEQLERVEILKGQGSKVFGPNAFSGAINFITKKTRETNIGFQLSGGTYHSYNASAHGALSMGNLSNHVSLSRKRSDGYIANTNYDLVDLSYSGSLNIFSGVINAFYGYGDHKFGANSFYATKFPKQWEQIKTNLVSLSGTFGSEELIITPKIYWRKKDDEFLLDYSDPAFYQNLHETNSFGGEVQTTVTSPFGKTSFGAEYNKHDIESTNLGTHSRENKGVFIEHNYSPTENIFISAGAFLYNYAEIGWKLWPGIDASYKFTKSFKAFVSVGKAFRTPSYTELYYSDPVTVGNANLESEETLNYELGLTYAVPFAQASFSFFRKEGSNIIDWIRTTEDNPWEARNISEVNTNGLEVSLNLSLNRLLEISFINGLSVNYTYLDIDKNSSTFDSRYVLDHLQNQLILGIHTNYFNVVNHSWLVRYEDRVNFETNTIVDTQLSKPMSSGELYLKIENLFNKTHHDISGVVLPGRWINVGFKLNFSGM